MQISPPLNSNSRINSLERNSKSGSRPASRVRVTFFECEKPLAVSSPENSDILEFDLSATNNMTLPGSPNANQHSPSAYANGQMSESIGGWENPFRPEGELSKEADHIVELIKEGRPINEENLRSKSSSVLDNMTMIVNGSATNGGNVDVQHGIASPTGGGVEHVNIKKKKGCCVIQ